MKNQITKKGWLLGLLVGLVMLVGASPVMAGYIQVGSLFDGNDNKSAVLAELKTFAGYCFSDCVNAEGFALTLIGKSDETPNFTFSTGTSGSWTMDGSYTGPGPMFVVVKTSDRFKIYYAENCMPGLTGEWDTFDILNANDIAQDMSHISLYGADCPAVPIPGAVWLLGSGLGALMVGRRRKRKA